MASVDDRFPVRQVLEGVLSEKLDKIMSWLIIEQGLQRVQKSVERRVKSLARGKESSITVHNSSVKEIKSLGRGGGVRGVGIQRTLLVILYLEQWSPTFLASKINFVGDNFSTNPG